MLKRTLKVLIPSSLVLGGLVLTTDLSFAKKEYTAKEKKGCTFCHTAANKKDLNEVGKCYAENNHSLDGCDTKK